MQDLKQEALTLFGDNPRYVDYFYRLSLAAESARQSDKAVERERCAKIAEGVTCVYGGPALRVEGFDMAKNHIADLIRKDRGGDPPHAKCIFCYSVLDISGKCLTCKMPQGGK